MKRAQANIAAHTRTNYAMAPFIYLFGVVVFFSFARRWFSQCLGFGVRKTVYNLYWRAVIIK